MFRRLTVRSWPELSMMSTVHQPVLATDPDLRFAVGLLVPLRHEAEHVDRTRVRERVGPDVLRRVALARLLHELPDQIRTGGAVLGDAGPDHLAGRRARRVEPEEAAVRDDAIALGRGETHGKTTGAQLVQPATRRVGGTDHGVGNDLYEVGGEARNRLVGGAGAVEDRPGVGGLEREREPDRNDCGLRIADCGFDRLASSA